MRVVIRCAPVLIGAVFLSGCGPQDSAPGGGYLPTGNAGTNPAGGVSGGGGNSACGGVMAGGISGGGETTMGGQNSGGMGGSPAGGAGAAPSGGGGAGGAGGPKPTTGCGKDPGQALGPWQVYTVPLDGQTLGNPHQHTEREIFVRLPQDYDPMTPYRIVYIGVGCSAPDGASAAYPLWEQGQGGDPQAIYVAMSLPDPSTNNNCYDNRAGVNSIEWESLDHDHAFVSDRFCIDNDKVFMGGYSSGSWIANMFSCYFGGIPNPPRKFLPNVALRGVMSVAGCWIEGNPPCNGPVGGLWIHDEGDTVPNAYACAQEQRDRLLMQNGCTGGADGPTEEWGGDFFNAGTCLKYTACPAEYPVIFCSTTGRGHGSQNDNAVAGFSQFASDIEAAAP